MESRYFVENQKVFITFHKPNETQMSNKHKHEGAKLFRDLLNEQNKRIS